MFQCLRDRPGEHLPVLDGGEPEGELVGEVVAGSPGAVALNEGSGPEVLQTGAWAGQRLPPSLCSGCRVLR